MPRRSPRRRRQVPPPRAAGRRCGAAAPASRPRSRSPRRAPSRAPTPPSAGAGRAPQGRSTRAGRRRWWNQSPKKPGPPWRGFAAAPWPHMFQNFCASTPAYSAVWCSMSLLSCSRPSLESAASWERFGWACLATSARTSLSNDGFGSLAPLRLRHPVLIHELRTAVVGLQVIAVAGQVAADEERVAAAIGDRRDPVEGDRVTDRPRGQREGHGEQQHPGGAEPPLAVAVSSDADQAITASATPKTIASGRNITVRPIRPPGSAQRHMTRRRTPIGRRAPRRRS